MQRVKKKFGLRVQRLTSLPAGADQTTSLSRPSTVDSTSGGSSTNSQVNRTEHTAVSRVPSTPPLRTLKENSLLQTDETSASGSGLSAGPSQNVYSIRARRHSAVSRRTSAPFQSSLVVQSYNSKESSRRVSEGQLGNVAERKEQHHLVVTKSGGFVLKALNFVSGAADIYCLLTKACHCYDLIPVSAKIVVFDTQLNIRKAFYALIYNGVRAAPLWDSQQQTFVGMLCITDFIHILVRYYQSALVQGNEIEQHNIETWRGLVENLYRRPFISISPDASLYEAVELLLSEKIHRLPVVDPRSGNAMYVLTHKRILKYIYLKMNDVGSPNYMSKTLAELKLGTCGEVLSITPRTVVLDALRVFLKEHVSALPVVDPETNKLIDVYAKFDVLRLAYDKCYNNLSGTIGDELAKIRLDQKSGNELTTSSPTPSTGEKGKKTSKSQLAHEEALKSMAERSPRMVTCQTNEPLIDIVERIVTKGVHRLFIVDDEQRVLGVLSLSDLLKYMIVDQSGITPQPGHPAFSFAQTRSLVIDKTQKRSRAGRYSAGHLLGEPRPMGEPVDELATPVVDGPRSAGPQSAIGAV